MESSCRIAHLSFLRYYGENVLHMATTNEDPAMVKYLLDAGVNFQVSTQNILIRKVSTQNTLLFCKKNPFLQEPCFGNFFSTTDQQASRS